MGSDYTKVSLWKRTLERQTGSDPFAAERDRLRIAFQTMREHVKPLVAQAHQDCEGLTVHDVTHLDALWETADLIVGADYELNPLEAFIFGAALLVHDAGMAVAAFEGGIKAIKSSETWKDTIASLLRHNQIPVTDAAVAQPPQKIVPAALFITLRTLAHAAEAERLITRHCARYRTRIQNFTSWTIQI